MVNKRHRRILYNSLFDENYKPNTILLNLLNYEIEDYNDQSLNIISTDTNYIDLPYWNLESNTYKFECLFDTGAKKSVLIFTTYNALPEKSILSKTEVPHLNATGFNGTENGAFQYKILLELNINNNKFQHEFLVLKKDHMFNNNILGFDFMTNFNCIITHPFAHENWKLQLEDPNIFITFNKKQNV